MKCTRCGKVSETEFCSLKCYDNHLVLDKCRHTNVKVDRDKDIYICRDCNKTLDEETKAKVKELF